MIPRTCVSAYAEVRCTCMMPTDALSPAADRTDEHLLTSFRCVPSLTSHCLWKPSSKGRSRKTRVGRFATPPLHECFTGLRYNPGGL